jgi:hypothetical protein
MRSLFRDSHQVTRQSPPALRIPAGVVIASSQALFRKRLRASAVAALAAGVALLAASPASANTVIDTTTSSTPVQVSPFGPVFATWGQTITVPTDDTDLTSFSFFVNLPTSVAFRAEVYQWDPTNHRAMGANLYESAPVHTQRTLNSDGYEEVRFNTGGLQLMAGTQYVLFITTSKDPTTDTATGFVEGRAADVYGGGAAWVLVNAFNPSAWTNTSWFDFHNPFDAAIKATLSHPTAMPTSVGLSPLDATDPVGTSHTTTATATDGSNNPVSGTTIAFRVTGADSMTGSCTTDGNGQCSFTYTGPDLPGADLITGWADLNGNSQLDSSEPSGTATQAWVLPEATPGQATGGGQVMNSAGTDKIAFGFTAKSDSAGLKGECTLVDPSTLTRIKCTGVTSLAQSGTEASIYGDATVNGAATTFHMVVDDNADPGAGHDTFRLHTASGYTAEGTLTNGDVALH